MRFVSETLHSLFTIIHRTGRCYAGGFHTMGGRQKESTMRYCRGFDRTSQTRQHSLGSSMNCGNFSSVAGKRNVRCDRTCGPSVLVWKKSSRSGMSGQIYRRLWLRIPIRPTRVAIIHALLYLPPHLRYNYSPPSITPCSSLPLGRVNNSTNDSWIKFLSTVPSANVADFP